LLLTVSIFHLQGIAPGSSKIEYLWGADSACNQPGKMCQEHIISETSGTAIICLARTVQVCTPECRPSKEDEGCSSSFAANLNLNLALQRCGVDFICLTFLGSPNSSHPRNSSPGFLSRYPQSRHMQGSRGRSWEMVSGGETNYDLSLGSHVPATKGRWYFKLSFTGGQCAFHPCLSFQPIQRDTNSLLFDPRAL
jgi:hypothetical protein